MEEETEEEKKAREEKQKRGPLKHGFESENVSEEELQKMILLEKRKNPVKK